MKRYLPSVRLSGSELCGVGQITASCELREDESGDCYRAADVQQLAKDVLPRLDCTHDRFCPAREAPPYGECSCGLTSVFTRLKAIAGKQP
jgi:hypothetical protein